MVYTLLIKRFPDSIITTLFALVFLDVLLLQMVHGNALINIAWFVVPVLSILFCDKFLYYIVLVINYSFLVLANILNGPYILERNAIFETEKAAVVDKIAAYTIEMVFIAIAGYFILDIIIAYYHTLAEKFETIKDNEKEVLKQVAILDSMAQIYDKVNLLDFEKMTEKPLKHGKKQSEFPLNLKTQHHTYMTQNMMDMIVADQLDDFIEFTDIQTLLSRLKDKKLITGEFMDRYAGWFRAQYIPTKINENGFPVQVIFTIQNIDKEKRREELLLRIALTDELTRLYNRRSYEEDLIELQKKGNYGTDFAIFSIDVNGLKHANDTMGHAAGDELIKAAADSLVQAIGTRGKAYRTGGDEFIALVHTSDCKALKHYIKSFTDTWSGTFSDHLSVAIGFASVKEYPDLSMEDLEKKAEQMMYEDKSEYYRRSGIDRRHTPDSSNK